MILHRTRLTHGTWMLWRQGGGAAALSSSTAKSLRKSLSSSAHPPPRLRPRRRGLPQSCAAPPPARDDARSIVGAQPYLALPGDDDKDTADALSSDDVGEGQERYQLSACFLELERARCRRSSSLKLSHSRSILSCSAMAASARLSAAGQGLVLAAAEAGCSASASARPPSPLLVVVDGAAAVSSHSMSIRSSSSSSSFTAAAAVVIVVAPPMMGGAANGQRRDDTAPGAAAEPGSVSSPRKAAAGVSTSATTRSSAAATVVGKVKSSSSSMSAVSWSPWHLTMDGTNDASAPSKLHTRLRLWEFPDCYIFEPIDGLADLYLSVSRASGTMNLVEELPPRGSSANPKVQTIYGVIGVLKLAVGSYFLVITDRDCVGSHLGHAVFKVTGLRVLPCNYALSSSSAEKKKMDKEFSELLDAAERTIGLHFSYDINLTVSAQKLHDLGDEFKSLPLWRQAEQRFLWNSYLLEPLIENKLDRYLLPVIQGSFQNIHAEVGSEKVIVTLIARRCTRRIGTRMWRRGADPEGHAANFVESEQIMQSKGFTASYVQVRGSMPFLWEQIVDLTYKPNFDIVRQEDAPHVLERHFHDLQKKYGAVLAVDLVNTGGGEGRLRERYAKSIEPILSEDLSYVHFDFHRICGHIHFERLSQLYEKIEGYLKKHRYFLINNKDEKIEEQTGIVRTNCIDCLDRTNVTQSMIGGKILESQLQRIGVLGVNDAISNHRAFDTDYKILWANHGDAISKQYSGTPALKGDYVRFGKRSTQGILNDLWNSLTRYYLNNFVDGTKQDAMDLLQGHYMTSVSRDMAVPGKAGLLETYASFRLAFALVMGALIFMTMSLRQARNDVRHLLLSLLWAGLCIGITHFVRANGRTFTNRPRFFRSRH